MIIEIRQYQQFGPNGDRATEKVEYFDYKVFLIQGAGDREVMVADFNGFDSWHNSPTMDRKGEAFDLANRLFEFDHGYFAKIKFAEFRKKVIVAEEWERY